MKKIFQERIDDETMVLNFGPSHPAMHGTLRMILKLDGERVTDCDAEIGYLHCGFEKLGESLNYQQYVTVTDRMNYLSPLSNNIAYSLSVEKLFDIESPERAQILRVMMAELSRIADHLVSVGMQAVDIGAFTAFLYGFTEREEIYDLFEAATGTRLTTGFTRIGGMMRDVDDDFLAGVKKLIPRIYSVADEIEGLLSHNRIWLDRTRFIGQLKPDFAVDWGCSGPILRATGVDYDIRTKEPYLDYENYNFDIPIGENGDAYDRYLVRMEEIRQSARIIEQTLEKIKPGAVNIDSDSKTILPPKEEVYNSIEALIHHFELTMENRGVKPPIGETYVPTEAPNGELGFYITSNGTNKPVRVRTRPPSFLHYAIFPEIMKGAMIADIVAVLGSLNIIAGELDR